MNAHQRRKAGKLLTLKGIESKLLSGLVYTPPVKGENLDAKIRRFLRTLNSREIAGLALHGETVLNKMRISEYGKETLLEQMRLFLNDIAERDLLEVTEQSLLEACNEQQ